MHDPYCELISNFNSWSRLGWTITAVEEKFLQLYIGNFYSVYDIRSYLKTAVDNKNMHRRFLNPTISKPTDYKNIHRRIQKLKKLNLIEVVNSLSKKSNHGAKYYKLTEKGIFYIIGKTHSLIGEYKNITQIFKLLHANYPESFVFSLFISPFIEYGTVEGIYGTAQATALWRYLGKCCEEVEDLAQLVQGGEQIFIWSDLERNVTRKFTDLGDIRLGEFLRRRFNLDWLNDAQITKFESDNVVRISHRGKSVLIQLNESKTKALLKIDRQEKMKLNVTLFRDKQNKPYVFDICAPTEPIYKTQQINLEGRLRNLTSKLFLELLSYPIIENDINILSRDKKFVNLLKKIKQDFNDRCNLIIKTQ